MVSAARSDAGERVAGQGVDLAVERGRFGAVAVRPDLRPSSFSSARAVANAVGEFGGDDDVLRRDDVDAMGERRADQVGVDQRDHAADAR